MTEQSREEFEKWFKSELPTTWRLAYGDTEDGEDELVNSAKASIIDMMTAWKAARKGIVIMLPESDLSGMHIKYYSDDTVISFIEDAGLTVK